MAKRQIVKGSTAVILDIFIQDSNSAQGAGITGLANNSSGLTCYYHRNTDANATAVTLVTMTAGTYTTSGFVQIDANNMPGFYQLCLNNNAFLTGANSVSALLKSGNNGNSVMLPCALEIELTATDNQDAVRGGMTALPNANAAATGGLPTVDGNNSVKVQSGTGANQLNLSSGNVSLTAGQLFIKKNTALSAFEFLMVSSTDHVTPKTGLTITSTRSIDGGAFSATANSATEISSGIYSINLANTDTNGTVITFLFTGSGADNRYVTFVTQA